jgi:hypothetical protein
VLLPSEQGQGFASELPADWSIGRKVKARIMAKQSYSCADARRMSIRPPRCAPLRLDAMLSMRRSGFTLYAIDSRSDAE